MKFNTRSFFYAMPPAWRFMVRRLYFLPLDIFERISGKRDSLTPPKGLIFTGGGDFRLAGQKLLSYFIEFGGLQTHHFVMDVGSGIGRVALPLTTFLDETGSYEGFDIIQLGVQWCRKNISSKFPNFHFRYIPIENDLYRSSGQQAATFKFPYPKEHFDFVVVNSVFTHMLPVQVENYLKEIARVLKKGGRCYATFFLLNEETIAKMSSTGFDFPFNYGHYRLMDDKVKSANVAFDEEFLKKDLLQVNGLKITNLFYGSWRGLPKNDCKEFQDIAIFVK